MNNFMRKLNGDYDEEEAKPRPGKAQPGQQPAQTTPSVVPKKGRSQLNQQPVPQA